MGLGAGVPTCFECTKRFSCTPKIIGDYFDNEGVSGGGICHTEVSDGWIDSRSVSKKFKEELIAAGIEGAEGLTAE